MPCSLHPVQNCLVPLPVHSLISAFAGHIPFSLACSEWIVTTCQTVLQELFCHPLKYMCHVFYEVALFFVGLGCTFTTLFIIIQLWIREGQGPYSEWPLKLNLNSSEGNSSAALGDSSKWRWSIGYGIHYLLSNWTSWPCLNVYSREYYNGNFINICRKENIKENKIYHPHFLP